MAIEIYKTQTLLTAIINMPKTHTFLRDTFFPNTETFITEDVLVDIKKGKRKMAPFVAPRVGGVTVSREGYKTEKLKAPRMAPQREVTIDDISKRGIGENVFSTTTPAQRQAQLLANDSLELADMIDRREEWMAAQALLEGKVLLKGYAGRKDEYIEQEIHYDFENAVTLSGNDLWTAVDADILATIRDTRLMCVKKSGVAPDTLILGADAYKAFINNEKIIKLMDLANMRVGVIEPSIVNDAVTYVGKLPSVGVEIYTYDDWYIDDDDVEKPFIPTDKALLVKRGFGGFAYGAVTQLENMTYVTYEGRLVPKMWADHQAEQIMYKLSSCPVPKPGDINSWAVLEVVE